MRGFIEDVNTRDDESFFFKTWQNRVLQNSTEGKFAHISQIDQGHKCQNVIEFERTQIYLVTFSPP